MKANSDAAVPHYRAHNNSIEGSNSSASLLDVRESSASQLLELPGPEHVSQWPCYSREEAHAISQVLLSNKVNYWTGEQGKLFEQEFSDFTGATRSVAMANGTVVIEAALRALGIGKNDEVIVSPRSFIASASSILNVGATPVFADIDRNSQNITVETIEPLINARTRAVICVHLAGWPCDMDAIKELVAPHRIKLIEDCAQAHGATINKQSVGVLSDIGCWSFCQDKIITTGGEGGMVTTTNEELGKFLWSIKDHGKSYDSVFNKIHPPGFRWLHESLGTNWRMTEMQAAIGRIQLGKLPQWKEARNRNCNAIWSAARECPGLRVPELSANIEHAGYRCYTFVRPERLRRGWDRDRIIAVATDMGLKLNTGSCSEIYLENVFRKRGIGPVERLEVAKELGETSIMFFIHPTMVLSELEHTCEVIQHIMKMAQR